MPKVKLSILTLTAVLFFFSTAYTQTIPAANWKEFSADTGNFKIRYPGAPKKTVADIDPAKTLQSYRYDFTTLHIILSVWYSDLSAAKMPPTTSDGLEKQYDAIRDTLVKTKTLTLVRDRSVLVNGNKGRELVFEDRQQTSIFRIWLIGNHHYQLTASSILPFKNKGDFEKIAYKFLDSFEIIDKSDTGLH